MILVSKISRLANNRLNAVWNHIEEVVGQEVSMKEVLGICFDLANKKICEEKEKRETIAEEPKIGFKA